MAQPKRSTTVSLLLDIIMLSLIIFNLSWIFFDYLFESQSLRDLIKWLSPAFFEFYTPIHQDFIKYDLFFVTIYVLEFVSRWVLAVHRKTYKKWYIFPFTHWYDHLGCIPIGAFHFLRVLRIIIILRKLQDLHIIQWQDTYLIQVYRKYMAIITEEISDRVVAQVLSGMSVELKQGTPVLHQVIERAIAPRTDEIGQWLSSSVTKLIHESYDTRKSSLHQEIGKLVSEAAHRNTELKKMTKLPVFGDMAAEMLERTVRDMIFDITDQIMDYMRSDLSTAVIREALDTLCQSLADPESEANHLVQTILLDTIEVLKQQVQIQQWKTTYG